jgi:hypothetical protein
VHPAVATAPEHQLSVQQTNRREFTEAHMRDRSDRMPVVHQYRVILG